MMMKITDETQPYIVQASPSLKERLAALQKSQDEGWKERLQNIKTDDRPPETEVKSADTGKKQVDKKNAKKTKESSVRARPVSIADRLNLLESSRKDWKKRVEKSDAEQYTVAGKMGVSPGSTTPVSQRKCQVPELQVFRSKTDDINRLKNLGAVSLFPASPMPQKIGDITKSKSDMTLSKKAESLDGEDDDPACVFKTPMSFNITCSGSAGDGLTIDQDSFSSFLQQTAKSSDTLHVEHRTVKAQRRQVTSGNPIKKLASRSDLSYTYNEDKAKIETNSRKATIEKMTRSASATLANSALAGLASTEDFAAVSLRKVEDSESYANASYLSHFKPKMLIQIKGRRQIQSRLVQPHHSCINQGDCFILVTPHFIYYYIGQLSNVIEKSKSADVAMHIKSKRDLGYKDASKEVVIIDGQTAKSEKDMKQFWSLLESGECQVKVKEAGPPDEDENYESMITSTNKVYSIEETALVPCQQFWGCALNYDLLSPHQVYVFDFGSEMYIWHGKLSSLDQRKISVQLAKELWDHGYDYSKCNINPVYPHNESKEFQASERPSWALLLRVNQHMEPVTFKEKFFNWPNDDKSRSPSTELEQSSSSSSVSSKKTEMKACDAQEMINTPFPDVDLVLEMSHLGRGKEYHDKAERRHFEIETKSLQVWHAHPNGCEKLDEQSHGQFHGCDTYVVRWYYTVVQSGRALTGGASKHNKVGRDRCAYFFWQGTDSSINEKGACALMTVELDEERGPHVRVIQGKEPPCFLNIFNGSMMVHKGKRKDSKSSNSDDWRLYILLGENPSEAQLVQVQCKISSLRSRAIFMLVNTNSCQVYIWYGSKISRSQRVVARTALEHLKSKKAEVGFCNKSAVGVHREHEGNESAEFFKGLGSSNAELYHSLRTHEQAYDYTVRVYRLTSVSGTFSSIEMLCPYRVNDKPCPFPVVQADLYKISQPALFLFDNNTHLYLWQGWYPSENSCPKIHWNKERQCAMETCIQYAKLKKINSDNVWLVSAGFEPLIFKNLFPEWNDDWKNDIQDFDETDCAKPQLIADILKKMLNNLYTLEELKQSVPEGVDPDKLEAYLANDEFQELFHMTKEEFYEKPSWKQLVLRKAAGLF